MNQFSEAVGRRLPGFARPMAKLALHAWARIDSGAHLLPDYLIIGTQRGGTSSLYNYLVQHPAVGRALTKELRFFDRYYGKGVDWYRSCLPSAASRERLRGRSGLDLVVGEASPDYLFSPHAPGRVRQLLPDVKLIVLPRDPVERAWSGYQHEAVYCTVQEFLGLPPFDLGRYATYNATRSAGMGPATRARLSSYFRPHNRALYAELGRDFQWT